MADGDIERVLELGCKGEDVKTVQELLGLEQTGVYDHKTKAAVEEYQIKSMLEVNGKVTPRMAIKMVGDLISACTDESLEELDIEVENKIQNNE
jgi:peptidoglycan hydrolase-like protein with peptidoglycan-binding domain